VAPAAPSPFRKIAEAKGARIRTRIPVPYFIERRAFFFAFPRPCILFRVRCSGCLVRPFLVALHLGQVLYFRGNPVSLVLYPHPPTTPPRLHTFVATPPSWYSTQCFPFPFSPPTTPRIASHMKTSLPPILPFPYGNLFSCVSKGGPIRCFPPERTSARLPQLG